jgi:hypothetical protein
MLVFLPVTRFCVRYQVASGRPYSALERFILEAVNEGHTTLDTLVDLFHVHRRIVIEGLVTLMQAGWLALRPGPGHNFEVTDGGRQALKQPGSLPPNISRTEQTGHLLMEQVRGQIAPSQAVTFRERRKLEAQGLWDQGVAIPKSDVAYGPETGQIKPMLRTKTERAEYVRGIGPITFDRHNSDYLVVDVDIINRRLVGVPSEWEAQLVDELVERAQRQEARLKAVGEVLDDKELRKLVRVASDDEDGQPTQDVWRFAPDAIEFVSGIEAHGLVLANCLRRASSCVVVTSAILTRVGVIDLLQSIMEAVERGVLIDILWGWEPDTSRAKDHEEALSELLKLEKLTRSMTVRGRLQIAAQPSRSNVGVLVADPDGVFEVTLGCCEWLAGKKGANALSARLHHPALVSRLCGLVADLIAADAHLETSASVLQLLNASSDLDARAIKQESAPPAVDQEAVEARLLLDRQNELVFRAAAAQARERLILSSRRLTAAPASILFRIRGALEGGCRQARIEYGSTGAAPAAATEMTAEVVKLGAEMNPASEPPANYAIIDDWAFVTSKEWLGRARPDARPRLWDLGIALRGTHVVDRLLASIRQTPVP